MVSHREGRGIANVNSSNCNSNNNNTGHAIGQSTSNGSSSTKVNNVWQRVVRWPRPRTHSRLASSISTICDPTDRSSNEKRDHTSTTNRNGSDRRDNNNNNTIIINNKRYKIKSVLWLLLIVTLLLYGFIIIIASLHLTTERRDPEMVLRRIQSKLIQKKIIPSSTTIRRTMKKTNSKKKNHNNNKAVITDKDYFIVFDADIPGQGTGNLISGLLASHLLGDEFQRIVCVNPIYFSSFVTAFEAIQPLAQTKCPTLLHRITENNATYYKQHPKHMVTVINFLGAADECYLQSIMSDRNKQIIHFVGNTYPRWPTVPNHYFLHYYQPKSILLDHLPYHEQPKIVVHLREPDDVEFDPRLGLDETSLSALGETLPKSSNTYLVTNNIAYYDRFVRCCSWSHAQWETVQHSAMYELQLLNKDNTEEQQNPDVIRKQNLQMWSDWYTLLMADTVYHTHSDFSISAIHWMNNHNAHSILGYNTETKQFETQIESWWRDGETIPLVQRTIEGQLGTTNELRACV